MVFRKAGDLIATKYRAKLNAATMLGTGKTVWQACVLFFVLLLQLCLLLVLALFFSSLFSRSCCCSFSLQRLSMLVNTG